MKFKKLSDVEHWDGNTDTIIQWLRKMDDLAETSARMKVQLGKIIPKRLTGAASDWYWLMHPHHRKHVEVSWVSLQNEIAGYYMTAMNRRSRRCLALEIKKVSYRIKSDPLAHPSRPLLELK